MKLYKTIENIKKSNNKFFNLKGKIWINTDLVKLGLICYIDDPIYCIVTITTKKLRYIGIEDYLSLGEGYIYKNIITDSYYRQLYYETE